MATAPALDRIFAAMGVKKVPKAAQSITPTFKPQSKEQVLGAPQSREHLTSLYDNRQTLSSKQLMQDMFRTDPDVSATVGSYLTLADTPHSMIFYAPDGEIDPDNTRQLHQLVRALTFPTDYTKGFTLKPDFRTLKQELRYMVMLRGVVGAELVFDKMLLPSRLQQVDMDTIEWFEKEAGVYKPRQKVPGTQNGVMLDIPSFFVAYHRRDPTKIYTNSDFISVINTVAARQQVINDLYRLMQVSGFPRISLKVVEEVLMKNAPPSLRDKPQELTTWAQSQLQSVANSFADIRSDMPFAHFDSIEAKVINEKNPGAGLDITKVVEVLNSQNQAALKTMATVIGRGTQGVNTASVEARIAAMNADQLNVPVAAILSQAFTFMMNSYGIPGFAEVTFAPSELRPDLELEPQKVLRSTRMREDLSHGIITDEEYHLTIYGRLPPTGAPKLSGTGFTDKTANVRTDNVSPNGDSLGQSLAPAGGEAVRSN